MRTNRTTHRPRTAAVAIVATLLVGALLGACSAGGNDAGSTADEAGGGTTTGGAFAGGDGGERDGAAGGGTGGGAAEAPGDQAAGDGALPSLASYDVTAGRHVIRDVTLRLEVDDPAEAVDAITATAERAGGFVSEADLRRDDTDERQFLRGTLVLRVPAERLTSTLEDLQGLAASPPEVSISSQDVTGEVVDLDARLTNLRALETELRAFLSEAREAPNANPDTVLNVFQRVSDVRGQIEQLEARRDTLADLVALATIRVEVTPTPLVAPVTPEGWEPGGVLRTAARATVGALQGLANVGIWVGVFVLPMVLLLAFPASVAWWLVRRRSPRGADGATI